jgi:glutathione S-transferase
MIKIHHLNNSRSTRIIWLMEELGEPYQIVPHTRDPNTFRSPQTLERVHPLGKAPVIEDEALVLAESGAIIEYLVLTYGRGKFGPAPGGPSWARYIELLHFAEGSAMFPLLVHLLGSLTGGLSDGLKGFITPDIAKTLKYLDAEVARNGYLMAEGFTGADIHMSYVIEMARMGKLNEPYASLEAWMSRLEQRPAYKRAIERGGPVRLPI